MVGFFLISKKCCIETVLPGKLSPAGEVMESHSSHNTPYIVNDWRMRFRPPQLSLVPSPQTQTPTEVPGPKVPGPKVAPGASLRFAGDDPEGSVHR